MTFIGQGHGSKTKVKDAWSGVVYCPGVVLYRQEGSNKCDNAKWCPNTQLYYILLRPKVVILLGHKSIMLNLEE